jgi:hypothetical protein
MVSEPVLMMKTDPFKGFRGSAEILKRRIAGMKSSLWRWRLDEVSVKINGA